MDWARQNFGLDYLRQPLSENRWRGLGIFVLLFALGNVIQVPGWIFLAAAVLNYALALSGIGFKKYMVATLVGLPCPLPRTASFLITSPG